MPLTAAAAVTAGALGAAGLTAGTTPWAEVDGNIAGTVHAAPRTPAGHGGGSGIGSILGMESHAASTGWPQFRVGGVQLGSRSASAISAAGAHVQAARTSAAHASAARPQSAQAPAAPAVPYFIYDSVMPGAIPAHRRVATYADGPYAASAATVANRGPVLWIDTNGSDPAASALDVEPGDATPAGAAQWVGQKLAAQPHSLAIVYTMLSEWQQVKDNVASLPGWMQPRVRYWIADPTGVPHVVPGSNATQWYWGSTYDITTANPNFQTP